MGFILLAPDLQLGRTQEQGWLSQTINLMQTCVMFTNIQVNTQDSSLHCKQEVTLFYNFLPVRNETKCTTSCQFNTPETRMKK